MLNIDRIYHRGELQFVTRDLDGTVPLSEDLAHQTARLCAAAGGPQQFYRLAIGGGGLVYHTLNDTVHAIEPAAVEDCLQTAARLAEELD